MNARRMRRLLDVARSVFAEPQPELVYQRLLEAARELTGARYAALGVLNERRTGKLIRMLDEQRRDNPGLPTHDDPEVERLSEPTDTHEVARAIEERTSP